MYGTEYNIVKYKDTDMEAKKKKVLPYSPFHTPYWLFFRKTPLSSHFIPLSLTSPNFLVFTPCQPMASNFWQATSLQTPPWEAICQVGCPPGKLSAKLNCPPVKLFARLMSEFHRLNNIYINRQANPTHTVLVDVVKVAQALWGSPQSAIRLLHPIRPSSYKQRLLCHRKGK